VTAILSLARCLDITTIAEGVETQDRRAFLHQQGCDEWQGYLLGKPMPPQAIAEFLRRRTPPKPIQGGASA
jgi:EAL domain-containing protein (putative c-di-GMP-specific phosphodiesterase class I)